MISVGYYLDLIEKNIDNSGIIKECIPKIRESLKDHYLCKVHHPSEHDPCDVCGDTIFAAVSETIKKKVDEYEKDPKKMSDDLPGLT